MANREMLTVIDGAVLAAAFPVALRASAWLAGTDAAQRLAARQWTERFSVQVASETVLIPARLHFVSERPTLANDVEAWLLARALQTRSNDGFERQRAVRDILVNLQPWAAPFIMTLIGEYVVEILEDIFSALTPAVTDILGTFVADNPDFWTTIKQRVASYWNAYYRARWLKDHNGRPERRDEYVGFELIKQLESAASPHPSTAAT